MIKPCKTDRPSHIKETKKNAIKDITAEDLIKEKHKEYMRNAKIYRAMYYFDRLIAGCSAGLLCIVFMTHYSNKLTILLLMILIVVVILDFVFKPKENWKTFSHAITRLVIAELKAQGEYEKYEEPLNIVRTTENEVVEGLENMNSVLKEILRLISDISKLSGYRQEGRKIRKRISEKKVIQ